MGWANQSYLARPWLKMKKKNKRITGELGLEGKIHKTLDSVPTTTTTKKGITGSKDVNALLFVSLWYKLQITNIIDTAF